MSDPYHNEAELYIYKNGDQSSLVVEYGGGRNVTLDLSSDEEVELVKTLLGDINLWAAFINSLSAAILQHK